MEKLSFKDKRFSIFVEYGRPFDLPEEGLIFTGKNWSAALSGYSLDAETEQPCARGIATDTRTGKVRYWTITLSKTWFIDLRQQLDAHHNGREDKVADILAWRTHWG